MKFRKDIPEGGGSKNFIKLKDKESIKGIFMGELYEFAQIWDNGKSVVVDEGTRGSSFRFRVNFVVNEGGVYVPKIFENGATVYKQLAELHEEYDLESTVIKLSRNGTGMETTYSLLPLLKTPISKEQVQHLATIELLDLAHDEKAKAPSTQTEDEPEF